MSLRVTKKFPKLMTDRAQHRRASRRGQRLARKRLAKRNNTLTESASNGRKLPGYKDGNMAVKDIINKESRFNNRKRSARSLTPTANQCVRTHINLVKHINKFLPIKRLDYGVQQVRFYATQMMARF